MSPPAKRDASRFNYVVTAGLVVAALVASVNADAAPINRAGEPIKDAQGRTEFIIDFKFDPHLDKSADPRASKEDEVRWKGHQGGVINFLNNVEREFAFARSGMTSWVGTSATAFLMPSQVEQLARDKRVTLLTENRVESFSALPAAPWPDTNVNGEIRSWGHYVTNGKSAANTGRPVFIIDSGVAVHDDLPSNVERVNMACGNNLTNCSTGGATDVYPVVGCYAHATHVAGIVGGLANNQKTSAGINAGARMISVSVVYANTNGADGRCGSSNPDTARVGYALDYAYYRNRNLNYPLSFGPAVVNISINSGGFGFNSSGQAEANRPKLLTLVNPAPYWLYDYATNSWSQRFYDGAFVVQSAGNVNDVLGDRFYGIAGKNVCTQFDGTGASLAYTHAYPNNGTTNANDGVMVVGAINNTGRAVDKGASPSQPFLGYYDTNGLHAQVEHSSNMGGCVDAWAPGNFIYSAWGWHPYASTYGGSHNTEVLPPGQSYSGGAGSGLPGSQGWLYLSGTSMVALHVAGVAGYLADLYNLQTPAAIEQAVRASISPTGYSDTSGAAVKVPRLP